MSGRKYRGRNCQCRQILTWCGVSLTTGVSPCPATGVLPIRPPAAIFHLCPVTECSGSAVKFRHCPATVNRAPPLPVIIWGSSRECLARNSPWCLRAPGREVPKIGRHVSRKSGDLFCCVHQPRSRGGTEEPDPCLRSSAALRLRCPFLSSSQSSVQSSVRD